VPGNGQLYGDLSLIRWVGHRKRRRCGSNLSDQAIVEKCDQVFTHCSAICIVRQATAGGLEPIGASGGGPSPIDGNAGRTEGAGGASAASLEFPE
jgi:hypothetical protein